MVKQPANNNHHQDAISNNRAGSWASTRINHILSPCSAGHAMQKLQQLCLSIIYLQHINSRNFLRRRKRVLMFLMQGRIESELDRIRNTRLVSSFQEYFVSLNELTHSNKLKSFFMKIFRSIKDHQYQQTDPIPIKQLLSK